MTNIARLAFELQDIADRLKHSTPDGWSARYKEAEELAAIATGLKAEVFSEAMRR